MALCHDPLAEFAAFGADPDFQKMHDAPQPFLGSLKGGKMVDLPIAGEAAGRAFFVKKGRSKKYLLLIHEWWGLNDQIKNDALKWANLLKINVLALDLYDGKMTDDPKMAGELMKSNDPERSKKIVRAAMDFAGDKADFRTMGYCFGGGWSNQAAIVCGERARGCVIFYGQPETDVEKLRKMGCDALVIHPKQDKWITEETCAAFEKAMAAAGKKAVTHHFEADHAFANPTSKRFDEAAARAANAIVLEYLKKTI